MAGRARRRPGHRVPTLKWLPEALADLERLHRFLAEVSPQAARRAAATILGGADRLEEHSDLGRPMEDERREWIVRFGLDAYVLRYRVDPDGCPVVVRV